jgi:hypothetical protein
MIIIWGRKRIEKALGHVADFCPICRDIQAFEIFRAGMAGHVYGITTGDGQLLGYIKQCKQCGLRLATDPQQYTSIDDGSTTDREALIARTFPGVRKKFSQRLELEEQLRRNPRAVSTEARQQYLMEPFVAFNAVVEEWFNGKVPMDAPSGLGCLGTIILMAALMFLGATVKGEAAKDRLLVPTLVLAGIGVVFTLLQFYLRPYRRVRRKVLPFLALSLKPLQPTASELTDCLDRCRKMRMKIGKAINPQQMWTEMQKAEFFPTGGPKTEPNLSPGIIGISVGLLLILAFWFYNGAGSSSHPKSIPPRTGAQASAPPHEKAPPPPPPPSPAKVIAPAATALASKPASFFIGAPDRADMVHDPKRNLLYISAGDSVLRYQMASQSFLPPLALGGSLRGIDISPDNDLLAVADAAPLNGGVGIHLVQLEAGVDSPVAIPQERMEKGTFSVVFGADGSVWMTSSIDGSGGQLPLRKYVPASKQTTRVSRVGQDTMLAASADREFIAYADGSSSPGTYGRFSCRASTLQPPHRANSFLYEIGLSRDGQQWAVPGYAEMILSGGTVAKLDEREVLGVAFHPRRDFVFLARGGRSTIEVLDSVHYTPVKELEVGTMLEWNGNHAFKDGRLRLSSDGKFVFCTVTGGIRCAETGL